MRTTIGILAVCFGLAAGAATWAEEPPAPFTIEGFTLDARAEDLAETLWTLSERFTEQRNCHAMVRVLVWIGQTDLEPSLPEASLAIWVIQMADRSYPLLSRQASLYNLRRFHGNPSYSTFTNCSRRARTHLEAARTARPEVERLAAAFSAAAAGEAGNLLQEGLAELLPRMDLATFIPAVEAFEARASELPAADADRLRRTLARGAVKYFNFPEIADRVLPAWREDAALAEFDDPLHLWNTSAFERDYRDYVARLEQAYPQ